MTPFDAPAYEGKPMANTAGELVWSSDERNEMAWLAVARVGKRCDLCLWILSFPGDSLLGASSDGVSFGGGGKSAM